MPKYPALPEGEVIPEHLAFVLRKRARDPELWGVPWSKPIAAEDAAQVLAERERQRKEREREYYRLMRERPFELV